MLVPWPEDSNCTMIVQEFVILWRDNAADSYEDIFTAEFLQVFDDSREQGLMTCRQWKRSRPYERRCRQHPVPLLPESGRAGLRRRPSPYLRRR